MPKAQACHSFIFAKEKENGISVTSSPCVFSQFKTKLCSVLCLVWLPSHDRIDGFFKKKKCHYKFLTKSIMSEVNRIQFQTIGDKKSLGSSKTTKTIRFDLPLFEPNAVDFPQFNYAELVRIEKEKVI